MLGLEKRDFEDEEHYPSFVIWWHEMGVRGPDPEYLPPTGYVIQSQDQPIAGGFLYLTDGKIGIIGGLGYDSGLKPADLKSALGALLICLENKAKSAGMKVVIISTTDAAVIELCGAMRFTVNDDGSLIKEI